MENVFAAMQVCGYVGVAAAAVCVFCVSLSYSGFQSYNSQFPVTMRSSGSVVYLC